MSPRFAWPQYREPWTLDARITPEFPEYVPAHEMAQVDVEHRRIEIDPSLPWSVLVLDLDLSTPETAPERLEGDLSAYVLLSSARTNTRLPVPLAPVDGQYGGRFGGRATVDRAAVDGVVEILAQVVDGSSRMVATAPPWTLVVGSSAAPVPPGSPPIQCVWTDFGAEDASPALRSVKESYAVVSFDEPRPVLYLNQGIKGLQQILGSTSTRRERNRLRDTIGTAIARQTLQALFREAQARVEIEADPDDPDSLQVGLPTDHLLLQVCTAVADVIDSVTSAEQLFVEMQTDTGRRRLWAELDHAFDILTDHSGAVATAVSEALYAR